ncbi:MAG TPA: FlgD immunoglobulin-like domain containing protein [Candidatus Eisenbacteria bacterium]|nr:FlgD immunoglobulin-like domain containing protein [Candidatus Eisenbacteria bacterium]
MATLLSCLASPKAYAAARSSNPPTARPAVQHAASIIDNAGRMDVNNLDMFVTNHGSLAFDLTTMGPGLIYPKGTSSAVVYASGILIGAKVGGEVRLALGEYLQEFTPGPMSGGSYQSDQWEFKNYPIDRSGAGFADYLANAVPQGAPVDGAGDPLVLGDATIWSVFNDADPALHTNEAGSTAPLGVEVQQTVYAFNRSGTLGNTLFVKWRLLNKGANQLDSTYVAAWVDPDLGGFTDDLVGCDTTLSLGYCYNATNLDQTYGSNPPAVGFALLQGPIVPVSPGVTDTLGMAAFFKYINGTDPASAAESYNVMRGFHTDGSSVHEFDDPLQPITTFQHTGDPVAGTGWLDSNAGDRRFLLSTGPFTFAPGDTQEVVFAICVGQGADRLSSVTALRQAVDALRQPFDPPTAVSATLLQMDARPDRVRLLWEVPGAVASSARVFRREEWSDWVFLGAATPDGGSRVRFEDADVEAGARYVYRLVVRESSGEESSFEVQVDVPRETAPAAAALRFRTANPTRGPVAIDFGLPAAGPVRLEVYDARGARVATLATAFSNAGWHALTWDGRDGRGSAVASGIYFLRLEAADGVVVRKLAMTR